MCVNNCLKNGLRWFVNKYEPCRIHEKDYFVVMLWAGYLITINCDHILKLAFNTYTYFLEYNVIVI